MSLDCLVFASSFAHLKLVVKQNSLVKFITALQDGVGDGGSVVEGGRLPAVFLDLALDGAGRDFLDDGSTFVADEEHLGLDVGRSLGDVSLDGFVDTGMNTAAET